MSATARVAVLIPVFNDSEGLVKSLASLQEEVPIYEVIVVDDGSHPHIEIPENAISVPLTLLRLDKNSGIEHALNLGLKHIIDRGFEYVARLDAGDTNHPNRLYTQATYLDRHPSLMLLGSAAEFVDESGHLLFVQQGVKDPRQIVRQMHLNNVFCHPTVMMRTEAIRSVGFYSTSHRGAEDYELFFRIAARHQTAIIQNALVRTLASYSGISRTRRRMQLMTRLRIQRRHFSWREPLAYIGIVKTLLLLLVPVKHVDWLKERLAKRTNAAN